MIYKIVTTHTVAFYVDAESEDAANKIALDWAINWTQPDDAVIDGLGGYEVECVGTEPTIG